MMMILFEHLLSVLLVLPSCDGAALLVQAMFDAHGVEGLDSVLRLRCKEAC